MALKGLAKILMAFREFTRDKKIAVLARESLIPSSPQSQVQDVRTRDTEMSTCQSIVRIQTACPRHHVLKASSKQAGNRPLKQQDVGVQMPLRLLHDPEPIPCHRSITLALTNNARQTKQNHCLNKIVPRRLKMRVHSAPRCNNFYRHFPASSNPIP